jgi:hypothetical protein
MCPRLGVEEERHLKGSPDAIGEVQGESEASDCPFSGNSDVFLFITASMTIEKN